MDTRLNPYISFDGNAEEAMNFYHSIFGGQLVVNHFSDYASDDEGETPEGVMHAMLTMDSGRTLMGADTPPGMEFEPSSRISISLSGDDETELRSFWDGLTAGGEIAMPLEPQMWGDTFGMVTDRFGIDWMVNIAKVTAGAAS